jgi:hypothetical protein
VDALLDQLLDLQGQARAACWQSSTVTDPAVRQEVESFLRAAASVGDFLSRPARPVTDEVDDGLDIERCLSGEPVEARDGERLYRLRRALKRHRGLVAAVLLVLVSLAQCSCG